MGRFPDIDETYFTKVETHTCMVKRMQKYIICLERKISTKIIFTLNC